MATVDEIRTVRAAIKDSVSLRGDTRAVTAHGVLTRMVRDALDAELQEEIKSFGDTVYSAAAAGWNKLRDRNPNVDKSTGTAGGEINSFDELPAKVKLNYLTFAQGALYNNSPQKVILPFLSDGEVSIAPIGTGIPVSALSLDEGWQPIGTVDRVEITEPVVFKAGDKAKVTGPLVWGRGEPHEYLNAGEVVTVSSGYVDNDGDILVGKANGNLEYILATSLTLITEPRTWENLEDVPSDVQELKDNRGDPMKRDESKFSGWACGCGVGRTFDHGADVGCGPYTEVLND